MHNFVQVRCCTKCSQVQPTIDFTVGSYRCKPCRREALYSEGKTCGDCTKPILNKTPGYCFNCRRIRQRGKPEEATRFRMSNGYMALSKHWDHPNALKNGRILEHVKVMTEMLGRPLRKGENVHHKNGVRDDNRPENLELWVTMQPTGQRVTDLVAWAREILERYGDM